MEDHGEITLSQPAQSMSPAASNAMQPSLVGILLIRLPTFLLVTLLAAAGLLTAIWYLVQPQYEIAASLHISPTVRSILVKDPESDVSGNYREFVGTEAATILSSAVLSNAINTADVRGLPVIADAVDPVAMLQEWIEVEPIRGTELLKVAMKGIQPEPLVAIVNSVVKAYMARKEADQREWDERVLSSLKTEQAELEAQLKVKERQLRDTAAESGLGGSDESGLAIDHWIRDVQQLLTQANKEKAKAELELQSFSVEDPAQAEIIDPAEFETFVAQDPEIQSLRTELQTVELAALADPSRGRGPNHPDARGRPGLVEALRNRMDARRDDLRAAFVTSKQRRLEATIRESEVAAQVYESELQKLNDERAGIASKHFVFQDHRHERERIEKSLNLVREKIWNVEVEQHRADRVSVASYARIPPAPNVDKRLKYGAVALLMAVCSGAGAAFLRHRTDTSFRTPIDVSERLGVRVLGSVQEVPRGELALHGLYGKMVEPIRGISTALLAASPQRKTHVRLITSPTPASGKSSLSVQLARSLAATGRRVLLIDGDNHGQGATRRFNLLGEAGLAEFLGEKATSEEALRDIGVPNLRFVPSGVRNENFGEVLSSQVSQERLADLCKDYDEVIVDSPPVLVKSDALILATLANEVVLVLRAGTSRAADTFAAQQYLTAVGAKVVGVILNAVSPRNVRYAYGYSYHYNYPYNSAYATSGNGHPT